jgi:dUTP pyrophosphatase
MAQNLGLLVGSPFCLFTCQNYRGELQVIVMNAGTEPFTVERGMRIAQAVVAPVLRARFTEVAVLPDTARGVGGFGSTGTR